MTSFDPSTLLNPIIKSLSAYKPVEPLDSLSAELGLRVEDLVKLDANENPFGPPRSVVEALASHDWYHVYPDSAQTRLRERLAALHGVPESMIAVGSGSDELLNNLSQMFLLPGDRILDMPPTFLMYSSNAHLYGAEVLEVPRRSDYSLDMEAVEAAVLDGRVGDGGPVKIVYAATPNNPTGTWLTDGECERLLALPALVVLDEAYVEFADEPSRIAHVAEHDNLVVLRTFSKAVGMAGLRLGWGVFPEWLMEQFWKFKQPYNVNQAALVAGLTGLEHWSEVETVVARIQAGQRRLQAGLARISFLDPVPSAANFVLCRVRGRPALEVRDGLRRQGILVRYYDTPLLSGCIRISVGREDQIDRVLTALEELE